MYLLVYDISKAWEFHIGGQGVENGAVSSLTDNSAIYTAFVKNEELPISLIRLMGSSSYLTLFTFNRGKDRFVWN